MGEQAPWPYIAPPQKRRTAFELFLIVLAADIAARLIWQVVK